jgi:hypothetical protein
MRNRGWLIAAWLGAFCGVHPAVALAQCGPGTVCADYTSANAVFFGRVAQVSPPAEDRTVGQLLLQTVTFDVIEDFKGTAGGGISMSFDPAAQDARLFAAGEVVLVYARRGERVWFAGCGRTRQVTPDEPELITLRQLQLGTRGGSLEGMLQPLEGARPPALPRNFDLGRARITVQSMDNPETFEIFTQPTGYFLVPWLKPGTYRIRLESPALAPVVRDVTIGDSSRCVTSSLAARAR